MHALRVLINVNIRIVCNLTNKSRPNGGGERNDIMNNIESVNESLFESIKHINEYGQEYWTARELQPVLEYVEWRKFKAAIVKAMDACEASNNKASLHFVGAAKSSPMPNGGYREVEDFHLSRYACYLIAMNGDPRKKAIALAQTYFAVKTRQQELIENYDALTDDQKRLAIRQEMKKHNKALADAAHDAGVITGRDYGVFTNYGYMGLYGGMKAKDIHRKKGLKKSQNILDHMGVEELAANLFRATQTEAKLRRDNVQGKENANLTHYAVGKKVRDTIKDLGGTMPEDLPTPGKSIQQIEREQKKSLPKGE